MDEYIGLDPASPARFANWLGLTCLRGSTFCCRTSHETRASAEAEAVRYAALMNEAPIDLVCLGIGVNGHIAFSDPPVAVSAIRMMSRSSSSMMSAASSS